MYVSHSVKELLGYEPTKLIGRNAFEYIHPLDLPAVLSAVAEGVAKPGLVRLAEYRFRRKDGTWCFLNTRGRSHLDDPTIQGIVINANDVTQRRQWEEEIAVIKERQDSLLNNIPDIAWFKDINNRYIAVNNPFANMCGKTIKEIIGLTDFDVWQEDLAKKYQKDDQDIIRLKERKSFDELIEGKDGRRIWINTIKTPVVTSKGEVIGTVGIARDITERKRTEESLRKLFQAVEQSPASVVITDTKGTIEYVNKKFTEVTGYLFEDAVGKNPRILKSGEKSSVEYQSLWKTITSGDEWRGIFHNRKKNGELFWEMAAISSIKDDKGNTTHFLAIKEDITRRKKMEDELEAAHLDLMQREQTARKMLVELRRTHEELKNTQNQLLQTEKLAAIGNLAAGIAHEIKNPLAIILLSAERFEEVQGLSEQNKTFINMIKNAAERANKIIVELLNFSRQSDVRITTVDLHQTIEGVLILAQNVMKLKNVQLVKQYDSRLIFIQADKLLVEQAIFNLVTNAVDSIEDQGMITIKTYFADEAPGMPLKHVCVAISDSGCGISEEVRKKLFEPFFTTKEQGKGTGLGLSIVYGILERHKGKVTVESKVGEGSTFTLMFPWREGQGLS